MNRLILLGVLLVSCSAPDTPAAPTAPDMGSSQDDMVTMDSSGQDADVPLPDGGELEMGPPDLPQTCTAICGDLTGQQDVTAEDVARLRAIVAGDATTSDCDLQNGDLDRDGALTIYDVRILEAMLDGVVDSGCEPCVGSRIVEEMEITCDIECGDARGDCRQSITDIIFYLDYLNTPDMQLTACQFRAMDTKADGVIDWADVYFQLEEFVAERAVGSCQSCEFRCGDVNNDGVVDAADVTTLRAHLDGSQPIDHICQLWAANVNGNADSSGMIIDQEDVEDLEAFLEGTLAELTCIGPENPRADAED